MYGWYKENKKRSKVKLYACITRCIDTGEMWAIYDACTTSMGYSKNMARLWNTPFSQKSIRGTYLGKDGKLYEEFLVRVNSKKCPFEVIWETQLNKGNVHIRFKKDINTSQTI